MSNPTKRTEIKSVKHVKDGLKLTLVDKTTYMVTPKMLALHTPVAGDFLVTSPLISDYTQSKPAEQHDVTMPSARFSSPE